MDSARRRGARRARGRRGRVGADDDPDDDGNAIPESDGTNNDTGFTIQVRRTAAGENVPRASALSAAPNSAVASVWLSYVLSKAQTVRVSVADALGREVAVVEGVRGVGAHTEALGAAAWAPGIFYVARLVAGAETAAQTITVVR